jgi:hypothetical protein
MGFAIGDGEGLAVGAAVCALRVVTVARVSTRASAIRDWRLASFDWFFMALVSLGFLVLVVAFYFLLSLCIRLVGGPFR